MQKTGILGGGQLGRMLLQAAANYPVETYVLENDPECPAAHLCHHFTEGDITDFDAVYNFGKDLDAITIEIENVNVEALDKLESEGVKVYPKPSVIKIIRNKIFQKQYYADNNIPSSEFKIIRNRTELAELEYMFPAIYKMAEGGYDGKGVWEIQNTEMITDLFSGPGILEKKVFIQKEISQLVAINQKGETALYPPVEMIFNPELNLLDFQLCPAELNSNTLYKVEAIALAVVKNFKSPGIFAVEMFIDENGEVLVNETAPRVHNSGHHTIESHFCSQFDMLWRIILGYSLGNTDAILPSIMINIIGAPGHRGKVKYEGLNEALAISNAFVHIYGKKETRPGRKMGHITLMDSEKKELLRQSERLKTLVKSKT
jgi:5-(carboxyamino)imidazole ribonucleotide synthase